MSASRPAAVSEPALLAPTRGFQPASRRRSRIAIGMALAAVAIGGNVLIYANLNAAEPVVQATRDVLAGELITRDMLRTVDIDADTTVNLVAGEQLDGLLGTYAKVRLVAGSLITPDSLQSLPLVTPGFSVVAIQVTDGSLPMGLRERVPVLLVLPADQVTDTSNATSTIVSIPARVVGLPIETTSALGVQSLSVEVAAGDAATLAAANDVRVVLVDPSNNPAPAQAEAATPEPGES
jgi:hypothetical protein